ncbi:MAG TPA: hypothetical protein VGI82_07640 [Chitinophagaceae bacterium]|jgi:hypothetical protein
MKTLLILSVATLLVVTAKAQTEMALKTDSRETEEFKSDRGHEKKELRKLEGSEASYQAEQQFLMDFDRTPIVSSKRSENLDEFTFNKDGIVTTAFYDADADLVGTTQIRPFADLPGKGQQNIIKDYKGWNPVEVVFYDDNEANESDMVLYNSRFNDADSYFVELEKDNSKMVVQVDMNGEVGYFTTLRQ